MQQDKKENNLVGEGGENPASSKYVVISTNIPIDLYNSIKKSGQKINHLIALGHKISCENPILERVRDLEAKNRLLSIEAQKIKNIDIRLRALEAEKIIRKTSQ